MTKVILLVALCMELAFAFESASIPMQSIALGLVNYFSSDCLVILEKKSDPTKSFSIFKSMSLDLQSYTAVYTIEEDSIGKKYFWNDCSRPMMVMIADDLKKECAFLLNRESLADETWLLFLNSSLYDFFDATRPSFDSEVLIADMTSLEKIQIIEVYSVDQNYPLRTYNFGNWTPQDGLTVTNVHVYSRRSDLEGKTLILGTTENWPLSTFKGGLGGYLPLIWFEVAELINCTTMGRSPPDNATGLQFPNGSWNGLMGMLINRDIDLIATELTMTTARLNYVKFCRPVYSARYQVFFKGLGVNLEWASIFKPLTVSIWIAICLWIIISTICITLTYVCHCKAGLKGNSGIKFTTTESFFFILQSLCQQGYHAIPKSVSYRIIFLTSYVLSAVMIPSYSASLISWLTNKSPRRPFDSIEGLAQSGKYKLLVRPNSAAYAIFSEATNPLYREIYEKAILTIPFLVNFTSTIEAFDFVCKENEYAIFGLGKLFQSKLQARTPKCRILTFPQDLSPVFLSFAFRKNSPYTNLIDFQLKRMFTHGLINRIQKQFSYWKTKDELLYSDVEPREIFHVFVILFLGIIIALLLLVIEMNLGRRRQKRQEKKKGKKKAREGTSNIC